MARPRDWLRQLALRPGPSAPLKLGCAVPCCQGVWGLPPRADYTAAPCAPQLCLRAWSMRRWRRMRLLARGARKEPRRISSLARIMRAWHSTCTMAGCVSGRGRGDVEASGGNRLGRRKQTEAVGFEVAARAHARRRLGCLHGKGHGGLQEHMPGHTPQRQRAPGGGAPPPRPAPRPPLRGWRPAGMREPGGVNAAQLNSAPCRS